MTNINNRTVVAITIVLGTILITHGALALAEIGASIKCDPTFTSVKWPIGWARWLGCSIALHESLAAGLIGTGGAIFAGWLAYSAVQLQLSEQHKEAQQKQIEAKAAAIVILTQPVHAAAATLMVLMRATEHPDGKQQELERLVLLGVTHVKNTLEHFTISEGIKGLRSGDRLTYLVIVNTLASFVNISINPSPFLPLEQRWQNQRDALLKIPKYLRAFDTRLADQYDHDAGLAQSSKPKTAP